MPVRRKVVAQFTELSGMTTSISNAAVNAVAETTGETTAAPAEATVQRLRHTLPSRFIFLGLCVAIVLTALAFGTNHNWALAIFNLGALAIVFLWFLDGWKLGLLRISRNPLQLPLLGMLLLGLIQLLPLRSAEAVDLLSIPAVKSLSLDPYATTLILAAGRNAVRLFLGHSRFYRHATSPANPREDNYYLRFCAGDLWTNAIVHDQQGVLGSRTLAKHGLRAFHQPPSFRRIHGADDGAAPGNAFRGIGGERQAVCLCLRRCPDGRCSHDD